MFQVSRWIQRYIGQFQRKAQVYKENIRQSVRKRKTLRKCAEQGQEEQDRDRTNSSSLCQGESSVSFQGTDEIITLTSAGQGCGDNQGKRLLNYKIQIKFSSEHSNHRLLGVHTKSEIWSEDHRLLPESPVLPLLS